MPNLIQRARQNIARWVGGSPQATQLRRWSAARVDRLTADWLATEASINAELRTDLNRLRSRGRELLQNNDFANKFAGMVKTNIIGPGGIRLQVRVEDQPGKPDRLANASIEAAWADWCAGCDITGRQALRDLCETLVGGLPSDGEFLVRMVRGAEAGNKYGLALQVIDVDRIDTQYNVAATGVGGSGGATATNAIIMGVEVDAYRRPVALHIFAAHPNDGMSNSRTRIRVPASDLIHAFKIERAEQLRGIPWMAPGMLSLHHLGNFKLSALLAAEHGANHYGFFTTPDGQAPIGALDAGGEQVAVSQPGTYDTLPTGVTFQPHESKYPNEVFAPFVRTTLQRIASGWRVAYHSLANDLEGVSYSSIRSGALEERDRWAADQEWFIAVFMEPIYRAWLQSALLMGAITMPNGSALPAAKIDKFAKHEWQPRRWEWVDPKGDMEAKILAVKAGLMAPQDLSAAMGYDFDDTISSIAAAQKLAASLGVKLTAYDATPGATPGAPAAPADGAAANASKSTAEAMLAGLRADIAAINQSARQAQAATPAPAMPAISLDVRSTDLADAALALRQLTTSNQDTFAQIREDLKNMPIVIPAPVANITFEAIMPEQRSEAPVINVTNQVQPAPVTVSHPTRAIQTVERDANDEITRTVTTYES